VFLTFFLLKFWCAVPNTDICLQLANVLQIDAQAVKNAVSLYCRLGFAHKKNHDSEYADLNPTWRNLLAPTGK
jgi:hypothetical protein